MNVDSKLLGGLSILVTIVVTGGFRKAAAVLGRPASSITKELAQLESTLGTRLLHRSTRSVSLTDDGRRLYETAQPLIAELEEAVRAAASARKAVRGRLRVNVDPLFSRLVLARHISDFVDAHPGLELEIVTRDQLGDLIAEGFDVAVRFGEPASQALVARRLASTRILTVASPAYLERRGRPSHPADLQSVQYRCIQYRDSASGQNFAWEFHKGEQRLTVATNGPITVSDVGSLHQLCVSGHGIAQIMALGSEELLQQGKLVELFPAWDGELFPSVRTVRVAPDLAGENARVPGFCRAAEVLTHVP